MKKRKKISKFLKIALLLFITLVLSGCENENEYLFENQSTLLISKVENTSKKSSYFNNFYHRQKLEILWDDYEQIEINNKIYLEFKVKSKLDIENDLPSIFKENSTYSIIAYLSNNNIEFNLIEFRPYTYSEYSTNSLFNLKGFSGIVKYFDKNGKNINNQIFKSGYLAKSDIQNELFDELNKSKSNLNYRVEPCTQVPSILDIYETIHTYVDWYKGIPNSSGQIIYTFIKSEYISSETTHYRYEYYSCDTPHTGDEVYKSEYEREQKLIDTECEPGFIRDYDGNCVWPYPNCSSFEYANVNGVKGAQTIGINSTFAATKMTSPSTSEFTVINIFYPSLFFTMPSHWTNGRSATLTSRAIEVSIDITKVWFENNPDATEAELQLVWFNNMKKEMNKYGGTVSKQNLFYVKSPAPYSLSWWRSNCG